MKQTLTILITCCGLVFITACKKEDKVSPTAQKLQDGIWQISASTIVKYMGVDTTIDYYSNWRPCEQDDIIIFNANGEGVSDENNDKCPEDNQTSNFSWELLNNDTQLRMSLKSGSFASTASNTITLDLVELTDSHLRLRSNSNVSNQSAVTIETYTNIN